jgi:hypothetical protein
LSVNTNPAPVPVSSPAAVPSPVQPRTAPSGPAYEPLEADAIPPLGGMYFTYQEIDSLSPSDPAGIRTDNFLSNRLRSQNPFTAGHEISRDNAALAFALQVQVANPILPRSYREAMISPDAENWKEAIRAELTAIQENVTWIIVKRVLGLRVLPYKWVFTLKTDDQGQITKYKARLVVGGNRKKEGIDYSQVYAAVVFVFFLLMRKDMIWRYDNWIMIRRF